MQVASVREASQEALGSLFNGKTWSLSDNAAKFLHLAHSATTVTWSSSESIPSFSIHTDVESGALNLLIYDNVTLHLSSLLPLDMGSEIAQARLSCADHDAVGSLGLHPCTAQMSACWVLRLEGSDGEFVLEMPADKGDDSSGVDMFNGPVKASVDAVVSGITALWSAELHECFARLASPDAAPMLSSWMSITLEATLDFVSLSLPLSSKLQAAVCLPSAVSQAAACFHEVLASYLPSTGGPVGRGFRSLMDPGSWQVGCEARVCGLLEFVTWPLAWPVPKVSAKVLFTGQGVVADPAKGPFQCLSESVATLLHSLVSPGEDVPADGGASTGWHFGKHFARVVSSANLNAVLSSASDMVGQSAWKDWLQGQMSTLFSEAMKQAARGFGFEITLFPIPGFSLAESWTPDILVPVFLKFMNTAVMSPAYKWVKKFLYGWQTKLQHSCDAATASYTAAHAAWKQKGEAFWLEATACQALDCPCWQLLHKYTGGLECTRADFDTHPETLVSKMWALRRVPVPSNWKETDAIDLKRWGVKFTLSLSSFSTANFAKETEKIANTANTCRSYKAFVDHYHEAVFPVRTNIQKIPTCPDPMADER